MSPNPSHIEGSIECAASCDQNASALNTMGTMTPMRHRDLSGQSVEYILRRARETDRKFLYGLHCQTMRELITKTWGWDEEWQVKDFSERFRVCEVSVIDCHGRDAGAVFLKISPETIFIEELQILPEYQCQGIGSAMVRQLIERARLCGATVTLSVLPINVRAKELYERLGFEVISVGVPFIGMRHTCSSSGFRA